MTKALITGITGQDGAYLAKLLLANNYQVFGGRRWGASSNTWRLEELGVVDDIEFVPLELLDYASIERVINEVRPDEVYNLAAQSFVVSSFHHPIYALEVTGIGPIRILEAIRNIDDSIKFYQASSSEMFGGTKHEYITEADEFNPKSPYAAAKVLAHTMASNYRRSYNMYVVSGILFNHESPLRGIDFVTRKITAGLAQMVHGRTEPIVLGNISAIRDWGYAGEYVRGIYKMMQQEEPKDYLLSTGETSTVRDFVLLAGEVAGLNLEWERKPDGKEECVEIGTRKLIARTDISQSRISDVQKLCGNASYAKSKLGWFPEVKLPELVEMMVKADLDRVERGVPLL